MKGPAPKDPAIRQRRNKAPSAAVLPAQGVALKDVPPLPGEREWHPLTVAFWNDTWTSPMATRFLPADVHGLYVLVELVEAFWREPNEAKAKEIRQQRTAYGLTPLDRVRLQWKVEQPEATRPVAAKPRRDFDAAKVLEMPKK